MKGKIFSINISRNKGTTKTAVEKANLIIDFGLEEDAHGGPGLKQVSLLALESIKKQKECAKLKNKKVSLEPGDFAENITTEGLDLAKLKIGDRLKMGDLAILEISKIGKECHRYCAVYYKTGDCIMPREGIFARVITGGSINSQETIELIND